MRQYIIETFNLTKVFRRTSPVSRKKEVVYAVNQVNLQIKKSDIFCLVGSNGAGKTTLLKMLCGLIMPSSGSALVCGYDITKDAKKISRVVGVVSFAEESFFPYLTVRQNLEFFSALYGFSSKDIYLKVSNVLKTLKMEETANILFEELSRGMKQRLAIARGLMNSSQILFLDEPTKSLDPEIKVVLRKVLREKAKQEGQTIFYITHDIMEVRYFSDQVAMMEKGRVKLCDDYEKIMERWQ